jgi:hypothetical protein
MDSLVAALKQEMQQYLDKYIAPREAEILGTPWNKERVKREVQEMARLMVEPYESEYYCNDLMIPEDERLPIGTRTGYVVAVDQSYALLYDVLAGYYALISKGGSGQWSSWGIRGDACSTFLAR